MYLLYWYCLLPAFSVLLYLIVLLNLLVVLFLLIVPDDGSFPYKTKHELRHRLSLTECFTDADLRGLSELNPPALMPNGNVGTPVKTFLQLIQSCRLPPRLIRKLGLTFPKTSSSRRYGNVPFQYQNTQTLPSMEETVLTATGHEISGPGTMAAPSSEQRNVPDHTDTADSDEPQNEQEEDEESNADDVGLNLCQKYIVFASFCDRDASIHRLNIISADVHMVDWHWPVGR